MMDFSDFYTATSTRHKANPYKNKFLLAVEDVHLHNYCVDLTPPQSHPTSPYFQDYKTSWYRKNILLHCINPTETKSHERGLVTDRLFCSLVSERTGWISCPTMMGTCEEFRLPPRLRRGEVDVFLCGELAGGDWMAAKCFVSSCTWPVWGRASGFLSPSAAGSLRRLNKVSGEAVCLLRRRRATHHSIL